MGDRPAAAAGSALSQFVRFLEALNCAAAVIDRAGRFVAVNDRCCQMMGRPREQIEGRAVEDFYDDPAAREAIRQRVGSFGGSAGREFYLPLPDGTRRPVVSTARPLEADGGRRSEYGVVTMFDITEQKESERQTREQYHHIVELTDTVIEQARELKTYARDLEQRVEQRTQQLRQANLHAIYMLAVAAEAKDLDTGQHVRRIEHYSRRLATGLGWGERDAAEVGYSSILHDVGKMHVPDAILKKPGRLTEEETALMRQHTVAGERIISTDPFFTMARKIARSHHENWDGSGYPDGLAGEAIPLAARVVHVADVFDALTSDRTYKRAWAAEEAVRAIRDGSGQMFDPAVVEAFERTYAEGRFEIRDGAGVFW